MSSKVCSKHEKGQKCVRCLSMADELLKIEDLSEEQRKKVLTIRDKCESGAAISEVQVKYIYELRDEFMK